jgi:hypothetical protein
MEFDDIVIDVETDSVRDIFEKLKQKAYRGNAPAGGFDFASNHIVGRVPEHYADYTFEMSSNASRERNMLSFDPFLVPPTRKLEPVPKKSEDPFSSPFMDTVSGGMFGKALKAHLKFIAVMKQQGNKTADFELAFRNQWGIEEGVDLDTFAVTVRSSGSAMWGGIKRKPVAALQACSSAQVAFGVQDRGIVKELLGKDCLPNWPRIKVSILAIGCQLMVDDKVFRKCLSKLHFKIYPNELPIAPPIVRVREIPVIAMKPNRINSEKMARLAGLVTKAVGAKMEKYGRISVGETKIFDVPARVRSLGAPLKLNPVSNLIAQISDDIIVFDDFDRKTEQLAIKAYEREPRPSDLVKLFVFGAAEAKQGQMVKANYLRGILRSYEENLNKNKAILLNLVRAIFPDNFLNRALYYAKVVGVKEPYNWVIDLKKFLKAPNKAHMEIDLVAAWQNMLANDRCVFTICEEVVLGLAMHETLRQANPKVTNFVRKCLATEQTFVLGLSMLIEKHAVYWHNRYIARGKGDKTKKVPSQLMSKVITKVGFLVDTQQGLQFLEESLLPIVKGAAENCIKKRQKAQDRTVVCLNLANNQFVDYCEDIDGLLINDWGIKLDYSFSEFADYCLHELKEFCKDITKIMKAVLIREPIELPEDYVDMTLDKDLDDLEENVPSAKQEIGEQGFSASKPVLDPVNSNTVQFMNLMDEEDFELPTVNAKSGIVLIDELREDGVDVSSATMAYILSGYPAEIPWSEYSMVKQEILETLADIMGE